MQEDKSSFQTKTSQVKLVLRLVEIIFHEWFPILTRVAITDRGNNNYVMFTSYHLYNFLKLFKQKSCLDTCFLQLIFLLWGLFC